MSKLQIKRQLTVLDQLGMCFFNGTYADKKKKGTEDIPFHEYVDSVRDPEDEYIQKVELIRRVKKCKSLSEVKKLQISERILKKCKKAKDLYCLLKWKSYHVYPSCQFDKEGCRITNVTSISGLLVYDLQNVNDETFQKITEWKHTVAIHRSIGGGKNYALFLYCPGATVDNHTSLWEKGEQLVIDTFKINPESSDETKDVTRIRYLSYDPDIYYNPYAEPVFVSDIVISTDFNPEQKRRIDKYLDTEPKWFKFLMALAVAKGESGRQFAHTFSRENAEKYSAGKLDAKYDQCLDAIKNDKREKGITQGTLFWQLKNMGVPYWSPKSANELRQVRKHVYLTPSIVTPNRFAHVIVDGNNICTYYESTATGKASEPCRKRLAEILKMPEWPKFLNEGLETFNLAWIQQDTADICRMYYKNGTLEVTKNNATLVRRGDGQMVWNSTVLDRDYEPTNKLHEIAELAKKAVVNYEHLQIGLGYLLHRYWFRNAAKIVWAVDHKPKSRNDGRRGKDFFTKVVEKCRTLVSVKWKPGHNFWTSSIQPDTAIVHFEDVSNRLAVDEEMKKSITGDLSIEHKGSNITSRKFAEKPKFSASSQCYPMNYTDISVRGRIWLIEFTDYLQKNPPKKTLLYDDNDLSAFDNWMIECIQCYLRNVDKLRGTPELTPDQLEDALRSTYGYTIVTAVKEVQEALQDDDFFPTDDLVNLLDCKEKDYKTINTFKDCYEKLTGMKLKRVRRGKRNERVYGYEVE